MVHIQIWFISQVWSLFVNRWAIAVHREQCRVLVYPLNASFMNIVLNILSLSPISPQQQKEKAERERKHEACKRKWLRSALKASMKIFLHWRYLLQHVYVTITVFISTSTWYWYSITFTLCFWYIEEFRSQVTLTWTEGRWLTLGEYWTRTWAARGLLGEHSFLT